MLAQVDRSLITNLGLTVCPVTGVTRPECGCPACQYQLQRERFGPDHPGLKVLEALVESSAEAPRARLWSRRSK